MYTLSSFVREMEKENGSWKRSEVKYIFKELDIDTKRGFFDVLYKLAVYSECSFEHSSQAVF